MKRLVFNALLLFATQFYSQTTTPQPTGVQLTPPVHPPALVLNKFSAAYPNIAPTWQLFETVYSATYRDPSTNRQRVVSYDLQANVVSIENELASGAYPLSIERHYTRKYPRENYVVWSWEDAMGSKMYYIVRGEESLWFSTEGRVIPNTSGNKATVRQYPSGN